MVKPPRAVFAPYGELLTPRSRGSDSSTRKFGGYELDEETGLHFAAARYYDTLTARFLTADTMTPGSRASARARRAGTATRTRTTTP